MPGVCQRVRRIIGIHGSKVGRLANRCLEVGRGGGARAVAVTRSERRVLRTVGPYLGGKINDREWVRLDTVMSTHVAKMNWRGRIKTHAVKPSLIHSQWKVMK
jgi:hypothetical protein